MSAFALPFATTATSTAASTQFAFGRAQLADSKPALALRSTFIGQPKNAFSASRTVRFEARTRPTWHPARVLAFALPEDLAADDTMLLGVAKAYIKGADPKDLHEVMLIEPVTCATVGSLRKGAVTSYVSLHLTTVGAVLVGDEPARPDGIPEETRFCDDFIERAVAAARTWRNVSAEIKQSELSILPELKLNTNFDKKRVLNMKYEPSDADNVKQHPLTNKTV
eukprot:tig00020554_g10842.t1